MQKKAAMGESDVVFVRWNVVDMERVSPHYWWYLVTIAKRGMK